MHHWQGPPLEEIRRLMRETDRVAEIQNTLRAATEMTLSETEAEVAGVD